MAPLNLYRRLGWLETRRSVFIRDYIKRGMVRCYIASTPEIADNNRYYTRRKI